MVDKFSICCFSYPLILVCIDQIPTDEWEWCPLCTLDAVDWNEEDQKEWCNSNWTYNAYFDIGNLGQCRNFYADGIRKDGCKATCNNCGK